MSCSAKDHGSTADVLAGSARWAFECRDGFALARELPARAVTHTIADPPYDARTHARARSLKGGGADIKIQFAALDSFTFVPELLRISDRWVVCFCAVEQIGDYSRAAGDDSWIRAGIWHKTNPTPQISGDRPGQATEGIAIMHGVESKKKWNRGGHGGHWSGPIESGERRIHETQKPEWLMTQLIEAFTDPGDLVFDPTAGGATTGVACLRTGRRFVGCEIRPEAHALGLQRLEAVARGGAFGKKERAGQADLFADGGRR